MDISVDIDLGQVARELALPEQSVRQTVALLDEGNTVPFITRFRKEQTGSLDEQQIRQIQDKVVKLRALAERKRTILKSIHVQGKLTPELAALIRAARSTKRLEDLYLPYKPKKQTLATAARQRGLEPLAQRLLHEGLDPETLQTEATAHIDPSSGLESVEAVLAGVGHIIAEWYSERADIRGRLRHLIHRSAKLVSRAAAPASKETPPSKQDDQTDHNAPPTTSTQESLSPGASLQAAATKAESTPSPTLEIVSDDSGSGSASSMAQTLDQTPESAIPPVAEPPPETETAPTSDDPATAPQTAADCPTEISAAESPSDNTGETTDQESENAVDTKPDTSGTEAHASATPKSKSARHGPLAASLQRREKKRRKLEAAFKDYFDFSEKLSRIPPHRVLAVNRGERARILRARLEFDTDAMVAKACQWLVPDEHLNADLLRNCVRDALCRLVLPSLEREVRRELTEQAEQHAVEVFAKNLRTLLLQPPVHGHRVLAIDPGFRNGCKLVAIDAIGNVLDHTTIYIVGNKQRVKQGRAKLVEMIRQHELTVVAIGNGTGCRQTEQLVSDVIANELQELDVAFVIVNEAGASVYSTSALGREELPDYDATLRSAISIGRRLLDPLSELVKINPANIGVGLYQHDVKEKHLQQSLDAVVESCVNYVGVDVNTASPALLRYVSGLNQLTARRLCEYRAANGPFRTREQFREVPGFGNATFIQAAGFLKITGGDNPLDATWIHPESYAVATQLLDELRGIVDGGTEPELAASADELMPEWIDRALEDLDIEQLSAKLSVSTVLLRDIIESLRRPGRDPREDFPAPVLRRGILKLEDLKPGMELSGTVLNVVDFGVFVDIGLPDSGLVHISRLVDRFVRDPHEVVGVGDMLRVWVTEVDKQRRRVSLTAIDPKAKRVRASRSRNAQRSFKAERSHKTPHAKRAAAKRTAPRKPKKPKIVTPITKEMEEGKEPLRSFSDLMQFYQKKKNTDKKPR